MSSRDVFEPARHLAREVCIFSRIGASRALHLAPAGWTRAVW